MTDEYKPFECEEEGCTKVIDARAFAGYAEADATKRQRLHQIANGQVTVHKNKHERQRKAAAAKASKG